MRKELRMVEDIVRKAERAKRKEGALKKEIINNTGKSLEKIITKLSKNLEMLNNTSDDESAVKLSQQIIRMLDSDIVSEIDRLVKTNDDYEFYADLNSKLNGND